MVSLMNENKTFKALNYNKAFWHFKNGNFQNFHNKSKFGTRLSGSVIFLFGNGIVFTLPILVFFKESERSQSITYFHSCNHITLTLFSCLRYWPLITDI